MLVSVLASGSKGNSTLVITKEASFLIDAGTTFNYLNDKLTKNNTDFSKIKYILITHTHTDHTSSLKQIIKRFSPIIILTPLMLEDLTYLKDYKNIMFLEDNLVLDNVRIENIKTSHDTTDSRGYIISDDKSSLVQITDTGYLNQKYFKQLKNKNMYVFESNHNVDMLMHGRYPKWLKTRVNSDVGHLSNEMSSFYLSKLVGDQTKKIVLAHLSEENNTEEIALETIKNEFQQSNIDFTNIEAAKQFENTEMIEL